MSDRYDDSLVSEGQFEPGSNGLVLRNLRGIVDPTAMDRLEIAELARTVDGLINEVDRDFHLRPPVGSDSSCLSWKRMR